MQLIDEFSTQCRTKCPLCRSPSIITKKAVNQSKSVNENRIPFRKSLIRDTPKRNVNNNPYDYAECTKKSCEFKFCMKCLCAYHDSEKCPIDTSISPIEPSEQKLLYPTGSMSKRNLRRLCSLDRPKSVDTKLSHRWSRSQFQLFLYFFFATQSDI